MPYVPFYNYCRKVAERETRTIIVPENANLSLPPGKYTLLELYCDEPECDCRRVFLNVCTSRKRATEAVIAYGWESREFYARWMKDSDPEILKILEGPVLNLSSPQSDLAPAILELVRRSVLADPEYVQRLQTHYWMFRHQIDMLTQRRSDHAEAKALHSPSPLIRPSAELGRNDLCFCGSGKKYKKCCLGKES